VVKRAQAQGLAAVAGFEPATSRLAIDRSAPD
jgi:hypothetical protein